ncbi:hypothetical protein [uncultured Leifsonia sp.]|uniref:hypothetical protein n=1 Tax=uncultured Leifsonia sp. TaxID=340359 RepID=UPI0028D829EE|nr:hypothetical protein [uncultured Leifsonia sp.]
MTRSDSIDDAMGRIRSNTFSAIAKRTTTRRTRHRLVASAAAVVIVGVTSAAAVAVVQATQGQVNYTAECYGAADLAAVHGASYYLPGDLNEQSAIPLDERIALAKDQCGANWRIGKFEPSRDIAGVQAGTTVYPVPALQACQLADGRLGIFPSARTPAELCPELGLAVPRR